MMYNTLNSGVDLQGEHWFYCNPLSWDGTEGEFSKQTNGRDPERIVPKHHSGERWEFMNCYCCPPSVTRTTAKIHNWFYNVSDDGALWVNFYGGNKLSTILADGSDFALTEVTQYPWEGSVSITIDEVKEEPMSIHFRIPEWTQDPVVTVNAEKIEKLPAPGNYLTIERKWKAGDKVEIEFPMPIRLMEARPELANMKNRVAVMRGPVVYCMELPKQHGAEEIFRNGVFIPENIRLIAEYRPDFLGGLTVLKGKAMNQDEKEAYARDLSLDSNGSSESGWAADELYRPMTLTNEDFPEAEGSVDIELIPYYAWANRGLAYMDVWMPVARH
jgi:hypothetical protein